MNRYADIICFAKDWHEPKTSNNHVMEDLARHHRVLWVNSIGTRAPNLASGNDLRKIVRKVRGWFRGAEVVSDNLRVFTPVVLPLPKSRLSQALNRRLVRRGVRRVARRWGFSRPQLWVVLPNAVDDLGSFDESLDVYYRVDEWAQFTHLDAAFIREKEAELLKRVDVTFVVSQKLLEEKRRQGSHVHLVPHGVDHAPFARALDPSFAPAPQLDGLQRPIVGFYSTLYDWVDQQLIVDTAKLRPGWSFVLVGTIMTDITLLRSQPNIHMVESRPHDELPRYCTGVDVGIIPYRMDDPCMQSVNPLRLREYLAAGFPLVTVDPPEVHGMGDGVFIAGDAEAFVAAVEGALQRNDSASRQARSDRTRSESWEALVASIDAGLSGIGVA